jgi:hypothetical protein
MNGLSRARPDEEIVTAGGDDARRMLMQGSVVAGSGSIA